MAQYKDPKYLTHDPSTAYDALHKPGSTVTNSGIYRCEHCGREISHNKNTALPPQNHHQHQNSAAIQWRLIVFAQT